MKSQLKQKHYLTIQYKLHFQVILMYLKCLLDKHESTERSGSSTGAGSSLDHVAGLLVDMIRVSHRFENFLCHEKGIGKIFDQILEYPSNARRRALLRQSVWNVIGNYLKDGIDENEDIDFIDVVKNIGSHLMTGAYTTHDWRDKDPETLAKDPEDGGNEPLMSEE